MNIGIIGTGNMGRILTEAFLDSRAIKAESLMVANRTMAKALELKKVYPGIQVAEKAEEVARHSDMVFICVKPLEIHSLLGKITTLLTKEKCLVSITSPISTAQIETLVECSVIRAIPSITNRALAGACLMTYGEKCDPEWKKRVFDLLSNISSPIEIEQQFVRVASDIVSCGPAFFSFLLQGFIEAAIKKTAINPDTATELASAMIIGMGELLRKGHYTLPALQEKVCVKGGITGEGIKVLESGLGDLFHDLLDATHGKFKEDLEKAGEQYAPN
ncbi:late competence protein ComER [Neobacillus piezotolerans]|uniref:Pyrroline-5-carboxylate reductase n=1 Tax=Neobacillus piezotolerans TaxID=2259171 RepID=A0A3D8GN21_9BACI|nr:late competence protein ComER [Neobacillus piezotolerans]RDU35466.1 late competence protein ComER [Neobacillus piezotolerans]